MNFVNKDMTEQITTTERINELIEKHESAITQLEAVRAFHKSSESYREIADDLNKSLPTDGIINKTRKKQSFYIECANRVYRNYFHKWICNNSEIEHGDGLPM